MSLPHRFGVLLVTLLLSADGRAAVPSYSEGKVVAVPKSGDFVFSLLPKAFQRNPTLDMTVNTEVTDYGRLFRQVTPENPAYYVAQSAGFKQFGSASGGEKTPPAAELERAMKKSLASNGYIWSDETPAQHPSIILVYYYGSHNKLDRDTAKLFPELAAKYQLERAMLVGGKKYVAEIANRMEWGDSPGDNTTVKEYLRYQAADDLYFVVASAYDYASAAQGQKKLLWRTTMTVNSVGVNMMESMTPLIATASPFFGKETKDPEIAARRVSRDGRVEIGESKVINDPSTAAPPALPPPKSGQIPH
jgi:hypothetical protein